MDKIWLIIIIVCIYINCENYNLNQRKGRCWFIDNLTINGEGTLNSPFNDFTTAMKVLKPGDTLMIMPGEYKLSKAIRPVNSGTRSNWIVVKGYDPKIKPVLKPVNERALLIEGINFYKFENIEIDGNFLRDQLVIMRHKNSNIYFSKCKIGRGGVDGFVINESDNVTFDSCEIYYCVKYVHGKRIDAHGILYNSGSKLTVKNSKIHHNSGDCIQVGTQLRFPQWDSLVVINCQLFGGSVDTMVNGVPSGVCLGENAVDTKTPDSASIDAMKPGYRGYVYIENVIAHGFYGKYDWPAFAMNMSVDATLKNCVAFGNSIGYRLMGSYQPSWGSGVRGARVKMINCIAYNNYWAALWPENNIDSVKIWNCTFDKPDTIVFMNKKARYFDGRTKFKRNGWDVRNTIFVKPVENYLFGTLSSKNIYEASPSDFVDYRNNNYRLVKTSGAVNKGVNINQAKEDFDGNIRNDGKFDYGAFEVQP